MPISLSPRTLAVCGVVIPARLTTGIWRPSRSSWSESRTRSCTISPSHLPARASIRRPASASSAATELISRLNPLRWAATSMPRLMMSANWRFSSSSANTAADVALGTRRYTTPTVSLSLTLSARAAPSGTKPSSATARSTRSRVSARGLPVPLRTRETDAMDTPAVAATS